jgi:hypothetical protein
LKNDQLPDAVGTNGLHAAGYDRINETYGGVFPKDSFAVCENPFACRHRDVSTFGKRKAPEELDPFHDAGGVDHGSGKAGTRANRSSPPRMRCTSALRVSQWLGPASWLWLW